VRSTLWTIWLLIPDPFFRLSLLISRRALAPGFLDEPDASAFRLFGKLEVDRALAIDPKSEEEERKAVLSAAAFLLQSLFNNHHESPPGQHSQDVYPQNHEYLRQTHRPDEKRDINTVTVLNGKDGDDQEQNNTQNTGYIPHQCLSKSGGCICVSLVPFEVGVSEPPFTR